MGDRVYASIEIGGHLETIGEAETLIDALVREVITFNHTDEKIACLEDGQTALRTIIEAGKTFEGHEMEANYGNFDELDAAARELTNLWFSTTYEAGGGFPEGIKTFINGEQFRCQTSENRPVVSLPAIEELLHKHRLGPDIVGELDALVANAKRSAGIGLPPLTASPAVCAWLKIFGEKAVTCPPDL
ncbi:hypothetical protein [Rhizobium sp. SSA_523]|uniref:hypothetical protein n=1 Tax=Rhizobium sp. SSA_523 TaxID=2952477 RepID=UPI0020917BE8|nr:hypothetical protein [Rhizobium sp. SSA_523]MCO5730104.1 hypothetical protein [Rhizobium sp. SSA_523]WKC25169.1 hypothetical protein QTJ18_14370 [Rhizobium sp. SSA_523]